MSCKRAVLFSCSDHYGHRMGILDEVLREKGFATTYVTSDFDHTGKKAFLCNVPGSVQLHVRPYRKNLSVSRILSHREFARKAAAFLESLPEQPDLVAAIIPPNYLAYYLQKYKKKHPGVKLVFDIFDLWPETFPSGKVKKLLAPVFSVWAYLRDHSLPGADFVITECEMFRRKLALPEETSRAVYLCGQAVPDVRFDTPPVKEQLSLCYLGAINNVIDIPGICDLIRFARESRSVCLHIIGKGEREEEFIRKAREAGAEVIFHGPIYDDGEKMAIMGKCHFGLNLMKRTVCVGLTMKSVDYFRFGLPILNNIPGDTEAMVRSDGVGLQVREDGYFPLVSLTDEACRNINENVRRVFARHFDAAVVCGELRKILEEIGFPPAEMRE